MNITETISLLDELKSRATQGEWSKISTLSVWVDDEPYGQDGNEEFIIALHNNYSALRQAALDGERYRKAGEELAKTLENLEENPGFLDHTGWYSQEEVDNALAAYRQAVEEK